MSLTITEGFGSSGSGTLSITTLDNSTPELLRLTLNSTVIVTGDALNASNWSITTAGSGYPMTVTAVAFSTNKIDLTVTPGTDGETYTVHIPQVGIIRQADSAPLIPPYARNFTAFGIAPTVLLIASDNDARLFDVVFSEPVIEEEAVIPDNYDVSPLLTVLESTKVHDSRYQIRTLEAQTPGTLYTVTVSGIHDLAGNLI